MDQETFDRFLITVASKTSSIQQLLKLFFSFLHRKSDFYIVDPNPRRRIGFDEGQADALLLRAFHSFPFKDPQGRPITVPSASTKSIVDPSSQELPPLVPIVSSSTSTAPSLTDSLAASSSTVRTDNEETDLTVPSMTNVPQTIPPSEPIAFAAPTTDTLATTVSTSSASIPSVPSTASSISLSSSSSSLATTSVMNLQPIIRYTPSHKQIPLSNGGVGPGYWWSQTLTEITIHVEFPSDIRAKDIQVIVKPQHLFLGIRNKPPVIDGVLDGKVQYTDAVWNLEGQSDRQIRPIDPTGQGNAPNESGAVNPILVSSSTSSSTEGITKGKVLTLVLDKIVETWWKSIIVGHPEIDPTAVDSTLPVDAYDPDTQAAIRKVIFDQQQKAQGLPTSEEIQAQTLLDRAKLLPGSPFLPDGPLANSVPLPNPPLPPETTEEEEDEDDGEGTTEGWTSVDMPPNKPNP